MRLRHKAVLLFFATFAFSVGLNAAADDRKTEYAIPAGDMSEALKLFSNQSGVSIVFDNRLVTDFSAPSVYGVFSNDAAIKKLLDGSDLVYSHIAEKTWAVSRAQPTATGPALVRAPARNEPDEIIVTASYQAPLRQAGKRSLYTVDGDELRIGGALNVAEPIYELPLTVASISAANTALLLASGGLNLVDLHGLEPGRTLVLVNGRRHVRTSGGNGQIFGVDLNAVPAAFVERIEIVNQGAGAALGSDAVAGAVNIVMRDEMEGLLLSAEGGVSAAGDAGEYSVSALAGTRFADSRSGVTLGVSYVSEPSLFAEQRNSLTQPYGFALDGRVSTEPGAALTRGFGGVSIGPNNRVTGAITQTGDVAFLSPQDLQLIALDGQSFEPLEGRLDQLYDWTENFSVLPEIERIMGYAAADFEITPRHSAYAEFNFANTTVDSQIAPIPLSTFQGGDPKTGSAVVISALDPRAPEGLTAAVESAVGEPVSGLLLSRRFVELGPRRRDIRRRTFQAAAGVKGDFGSAWGYDLSYQYGESRTLEAAFGNVDGGNLEIAIDPALCEVTLDCEVINIFAPSSITPSQADYILASPNRRKINVREQIALMRLSGPLFEIGGSEASASVGVEHRRTRLKDAPDNPESQYNSFAQFLLTEVGGEAVNTEFFGNVSLPVLKEVPFAESLELGGAYRYFIRREGGNFSNVSGNLVWEPVKGFEFYAQAFYGGRAPNVVELFSAGPNVNGFFSDPCGFEDAGLTIAGNCNAGNALSVQNGFTQTNNLTLSRAMGNPTLEEESVRSSIFGVFADLNAFAPDMPGAMSISASWRLHRVSDVISQPERARVINDCFSSENLSSPFCGVNPASGNLFIQRDPSSQQIIAVEIPYLNEGKIRVSGLDAQFRYDTPLSGLVFADAFSLDVLYTYTHRYRTQDKDDGEEVREEGLLARPRHQLNATASLGRDSLRTFWTIRHRGSAVSAYDFDAPVVRTPAVVYVDAALQWQAPSGVIFYGGVENLFDRELPPVLSSELAFSFGYYDVIGRRFFAGLRADF